MEQFNVAIVVADTLRKDVMDIYGGRAQMPALNTFSREAMVYRNCYSPSPWTVPSHVSMFTGLYPKDHGIFERPGTESVDLIKKLEKYSGFWLPSYFRDLGYDTVGLSGNYWVSSETGFSRGFDSLFQVDRYTDFAYSEKVLNAWKYGTSELDILRNLLKHGKFRNLIEYSTLRQKKDRFDELTDFPREKGTKLLLNLLGNINFKSNFFLFMNMFEMHDPTPGERKNEVFDHHYGVHPMSLKRAGRLLESYVKEAELLDKYFGKFISLLKQKGVYDNTLIIFTSDHGQAFLEHGYIHHGSCLYDEITAVPLIVKPPQGVRLMSGSKAQTLVSIPEIITRMRDSMEPVSFDSETVYSESHGNVKEFPAKYQSRKEYLDTHYQVSRYAIVRDGYKLVLNRGNGSVEEFTRQGKAVKPESENKAFLSLSSALDQYCSKLEGSRTGQEPGSG